MLIICIRRQLMKVYRSYICRIARENKAKQQHYKQKTEKPKQKLHVKTTKPNSYLPCINW